MSSSGTAVCPRCGKILALCVCTDLPVLKNKVHVLVLQHPQEPDKELGTAKLANLILAASTLKTGFSVPNLRSVLGFDTDPTKWIVLFLGSKYKFRQATGGGTSSEILFFNKKGEEIQRPLDGIQGVVVIDGTWAQAKALWWRNAWLLKLTRAVINPRQKSLYGSLRREPRQECLSTIESIAYTLEILGEDPAIPATLLRTFGTLITRYREHHAGKSPNS